MRLMISSLFVLMLASCTNDKTSPSDAATKADAPSGDAASIDATTAVCTGQIYDACNPASSNCVTGTTCHNYAASNFSACVPTCPAGRWPNQGTTTVACNAMGICKPNAPNACTPP
jgi:hypothetical protein